MTKKRIDLGIIMLLTLLWALFFWRILTPTSADRVIFEPQGDFIQHYYAFSEYQAQRLDQGEFPLWNPYNHSGDPFAGNIQFVAFYPPRLIAIALADGWSVEVYQLEVAAHILLASWLMYAFLRVSIKRPEIAFIGSLIYAYGGYLTGYPILQVSVMESTVWLPLMLLGVHLSIQGWFLRGSIIAGFAVAVSLLGGHPQTTMQLTYFSLAYLAFFGWKQGLSLFQIGLRIALFGGVGAGLSMIQLLPAAEFTQLSYRVSNLGYADKANGFNPTEFFQIIWPGVLTVYSPLYTGVVGFILVAGALVLEKSRFWLSMIAIALFLSLGGGSIVYDLFYLIVPGFGIFRQQERVASIIFFSLVILAVYQLMRVYDKEQAHQFNWLVYGYTAFLVITAIIVTLVALIQQNAPSDVTRVFSFTAVVGVMFAFWYRWQQTYTQARWHTLIPLVILIIVDLFTLGTRSANYLPDVPENTVQLDPALHDYQNMPVEDITWRIDGGAGLQGYSVTFQMPDIYGTGPFSLEAIELLRTIPVERFWEVLAVRYITATEEPPESVELELLAYGVNYTNNEFKLFELLDPRPMAHLVYDYRFAEGSPEFARQLMSDHRVDLREMGITLYPLPIELPVERPQISRVDDFTMLTPEHMTMTVYTETSALLTIAMPMYPGWQAYVNDERVDIVDNYAGLMAIPIHAGENQVVQLKFKPDAVRYGAWLTLITALIAAGLFIFEAVKTPRKHTQRPSGYPTLEE